jgi:hypothetical protein
MEVTIMLTLDTVLKPNPQIVGRLVNKEAVLVLPQMGKAKVLNEVGAQIWNMINGQTALKVIAAEISTSYAVDLAQAEADTLKFAGELIARGMVEEVA